MLAAVLCLSDTVLLLVMTGKEKEKSLSGDRLKNPNNNSAASGDI
jgi:hypothetical protein